MESIKPQEITSKFLVDSNSAVNIRLVRSPDDLADAKERAKSCSHLTFFNLIILS